LREGQEQQRLDELRISLERKIQESTEKYDHVMNEKIRKMRADLCSVDDKLDRIKENQKKSEQDFVTDVVHKLVEKEENIRKFQIKFRKEFLMKKKQQQEKLQKFSCNMQEITSDHKDKVDGIKEKIKKVEENLEQKRESDEKNMKLKQELRRLKMNEKADNFDRKKRQMEYEQHKILERGKQTQGKIVMMKNEREFIQRTRIEAALQAKFEKERISQSVNLMTKILHVKDDSDIKTLKERDFTKGMRIMKSILKPEDVSKLTELKKDEKKLPGQPGQNGVQPNALNAPQVKKL